MSDARLKRLFERLADAHEDCGSHCLSPEEIEAIAAAGPNADPERLARVAACGACSEALRVLLELRDAEVVSLSLFARRLRRRVAAVAAAAAVLFFALWWFTRGGDDRAGGSVLRVEADRIVMWVDGPVWSGERQIRVGDRLAKGTEVRLARDARVAMLDPEGGKLAIGPDDIVAQGGPPLAALAHELGPERSARERRVAALSEGVARAEPADFRGIWPRGGIRGDRPQFRFRCRNLGAEEELILRVLDEDGELRLEQRFRGARTIAFPAEAPALERGRRYVWSVYHPRSGAGPLGGEPFKVVGAEALAEVDRTLASLHGLRGRLPPWLLRVLRAVSLHRGGLQEDALRALEPLTGLPDPAWWRFVLQERALLLDELGLNERVGPLKRALEPGTGR